MIGGWADELATGGLIQDREMENDLSKTLLVAEVSVVDRRSGIRENHLEEPLLVKLSYPQRWQATDIKNEEHWSQTINGSGQETTSEIRIPHWMTQDPKSVLEVMLYVVRGFATQLFDYLLGHGQQKNRDWHDKHDQRIDPTFTIERSNGSDARDVLVTLYRIENWRDYVYSTDDRLLNLNLLEFRNAGDASPNRNLPLNYTVSARGIGTKQNNTKGDWPGWR